MQYRGSGTFLVVACLLLGPTGVTAQCTSSTDARAVFKSVRQAAVCNDRRLRKGPSTTCRLTTPPACAGTLVDDALALAYGDNNPPAAAIDAAALREQFRCQQVIGKAVATFIGKKLFYLTRGFTPADAEARARRLLDKLPDRCTITVQQDAGGVILPDVGKQCDAAVGAPGTTVDATSLRDALVTLLDTWVDRVGPNPVPLRPNIVLILTDDQRFDTIGLEHSIDGVTPVMPHVLGEIADHG